MLIVNGIIGILLVFVFARRALRRTNKAHARFRALVADLDTARYNIEAAEARGDTEASELYEAEFWGINAELQNYLKERYSRHKNK